MRLKLTGISKSFGSVIANHDISLSLAKGEVLALLGENGAGKTTLMNILFGHYVADSGSIEVDGRVLPPGEPQAAIKAGIGMVHQHFSLAENLSVLDNIMLGSESLLKLWSDRSRAHKKLKDLIERFGLTVDPDAMVSDLSVGEKQRVEILKTLYRDARILILDEPTAVLTPQEADQLFGVLKEMLAQGLSVLFISHKLHEIMHISDRIAVLRHGEIVAEIAKENASKALLAEKMVGHSVERPQRKRMEPGEVLIRFDNVSMPAIPSSVALNSISFEIHQNEIVGLAGVAGNGQAGLASILNGQSIPASGKVYLYGEHLKKFSARTMIDAGIARIPEDRGEDGVIGEMKVWENLIGEQLHTRKKTGGFIDADAAIAHSQQLIDQYDVRCQGPMAQTSLLSGGNIQKLILARSLSTEPRFIIANQPVRGLDEGAIAYVQSQLIAAKERGAGVLLISEDLDELFEICDRIAVIFHGKIQGPFNVDELNIGQIGLMMSGEQYSAEISQQVSACA